MSDSVLDALMGSGGFPAAEFPHVGTIVGGEIVASPRAFQGREYVKGNPGGGALRTYPSGDPIMDVHVDVQAIAPDGPGRKDAEDFGIRRLYIDNKRKKTAIKAALIAAGASTIGLAVGGFLSLTWTGEEAGEGNEPAKTWSAVYRNPAAQAAYVAQFGPEGRYAPRAAVYVQTPQAAPHAPNIASTPPGIVVTPEQFAAMVNAGIDVSGMRIAPQ